MEDKRNFGLDILRILSMYFVVILHILGQGGILGSVEFLSPTYAAGWLMEIVSLTSVNVFGMLSGYMLIKKNSLPIYKLMSQWIKVVFYGFLWVLIFTIWRGNVGVVNWVEALCPVTFGQYWYFTAYFCIYLFAPFLNSMINNLSNNNLVKLSSIIFVLFTIMQTISYSRDIYHLNNGSCVFWLLLMYVIGAVIRKVSVKITRRQACLMFSGCILLTLASKYGGAYLIWHLLSEHKESNFLIGYTSPTIFVASVALLYIFLEIRIDNKFLQRILTYLSIASFDVYLFHNNQLVYNIIFKDLFIGFSHYSAVKLIAFVVATGICIYLFSSMVGLIRTFIFKKINVLEVCKHIIENMQYRLGKNNQ